RGDWRPVLAWTGLLREFPSCRGRDREPWLACSQRSRSRNIFLQKNFDSPQIGGFRGSSSDLLGLLVPALALTDTSAELPAPRLGRPLHGRDDRVQRRRDALTLARPELDLVEARPQ